MVLFRGRVCRRLSVLPHWKPVADHDRGDDAQQRVEGKWRTTDASVQPKHENHGAAQHHRGASALPGTCPLSGFASCHAPRMLRTVAPPLSRHRGTPSPACHRLIPELNSTTIVTHPESRHFRRLTAYRRPVISGHGLSSIMRASRTATITMWSKTLT